MWEVPVTWITSNNNSTQLQWLSKCDKSMDVEVEAGTEWVKFNVGQFGYYRVNYPREQWTQLANLLVQQPQALGPMDRASLLNDAFALAEAGHLNYTTPLDMIAYLAQETHLVPWDTVYSSLNKLSEIEELSVIPVVQTVYCPPGEGSLSQTGLGGRGQSH